MKIWVTKYALSAGIRECELDRFDTDQRYVFVHWAGAPNNRALFAGNDWHKTYAAALEQADTMRVAKIASPRKQIARLEQFSFARAK